MLLMTSGGGITTIETAIRFPVRLVESGPAGGAIFAGCIARQHGLDQVLSFDMGGTTAKICLIDKAQPQTARAFEVARIYRFLKGSGLPLRIPVIEMVEIGAGGGSIARIDALEAHRRRSGQRRLAAGAGLLWPRRQRADRDRRRSRARPHRSADILRRQDRARRGRRRARSRRADRRARSDLSTEHAALGISEMVDENMANAARVHAIESGKDLRTRTLIAFGGAAPLHAARVAEKLGIGRVLIPANAGVGSAVGLLARAGRLRDRARPPDAPVRVRCRRPPIACFAECAPKPKRSCGAARPPPSLPSSARPSCAIAARATRSRSSLPVREFAAADRIDDCRAVRGGLSPALQPLDPGRRNRDSELGRCR